MTPHRICAMGSSHLATAKLGWDRIAGDHPDYQFDFFGFTPPTALEFQKHVAIEGDRLVARTEKLRRGFRLTANGRTEIQGAGYAAFVTFGLGLGGLQDALSIYERHRPLAMATGDAHLVSNRFIAACVEDLARGADALAPFRAIRAISMAPIFLQKRPALTAEIVDDPDYATDAAAIPGLYRHLSPLFQQVHRRVGGDEGYVFLPQPAETLEASGLTRPGYIRNGVGFAMFSGGGEKARNAGHGNAAYGEIVMRHLLRVLRSTPLASPA